MGPGTIANFETLGYVDFRGSDYFRQGTHMHLSHIHEDVEAWYLNFDFDERVATAFKPGLAGEAGRADRASGAEGRLDGGRRAPRLHAVGPDRSQRVDPDDVAAADDVVAHDGTVYPKGTAIPVRADFNTLDNPFAWSEKPDEIGVLPGRRCALRRLQPDRRRLPPQPPRDGRRAAGRARSARAARRPQGFNEVLSTTHRQNFLVPPRRHR